MSGGADDGMSWGEPELTVEDSAEAGFMAGSGNIVKESFDLYNNGKTHGTEATFHGLREYFKAYIIKNYTFDEIFQILNELETSFLKTLEKK